MTRTEEGATSARLDVANHLAQLCAGASLIVLETVSRIHDGPETNDGFAALVRSLERIAVATSAAVVIVRHMSKRAAREMTNADTIDSDAGRGSGALSDAVRSSLVVTRQRGKALAPVTLTAAKTTHAQAGDTITWDPIVVQHLQCVRLVVQAPEVQAVGDAQQLLAVLDAAGADGITRSALHKNPPAGLGRARAFQALEYLLAHGRAVERGVKRGRNRQLATVYFTASFGQEAA